MRISYQLSVAICNDVGCQRFSINRAGPKQATNHDLNAPYNYLDVYKDIFNLFKTNQL